MTRIAFFIDGFNLYHSLDDNKSYHKYKWLNLARLSNNLIKKSDTITKIYYFTALAHWDQKKVAKHKLLIRALELQGVEIVYGKFKMRDKTCFKCGHTYRSHEEKQTDVNIAITLFSSAINDVYDKAIILSGDSDLIPAIKAVKNTFPAKNIGVAIPIGRTAQELINVTDFHIRIKEKHLRTSLFPQEIDIDGKKLLCPATWK
ncbi:MAG: hypothetical protein A2W19_08415 [Spirochaetes bacterium RBG_16_49_21]|nr:MAG: hypothetical protein A2W19_08415 [Spirochaetes bacterium RBG_16_49_21]